MRGRVLGTETWLLGREDLILHLCLHIIHSGRTAPLLWFVELDGLLREAAIDWAALALRLSPFDRLGYTAQHAFALGHFLRGRYQEAANAARRAVQSNPGFSVSHSLLVAPLVKLGLMDEARAVATRVLALQPSFNGGGFLAALAVPAALAEPLTAAWRDAGLPV